MEGEEGAAEGGEVERRNWTRRGAARGEAKGREGKRGLQDKERETI